MEWVKTVGFVLKLLLKVIGLFFAFFVALIWGVTRK